MSKPEDTITIEERVAVAIREEIVRQHRHNERAKCPAGAGYYEEYIAPRLIAMVAISVVKQLDAGNEQP